MDVRLKFSRGHLHLEHPLRLLSAIAGRRCKFTGLTMFGLKELPTAPAFYPQDISPECRRVLASLSRYHPIPLASVTLSRLHRSCVRETPCVSVYLHVTESPDSKPATRAVHTFTSTAPKSLEVIRRTSSNDHRYCQSCLGSTRLSRNPIQGSSSLHF